jgi:hypothetical protein
MKNQFRVFMVIVLLAIATMACQLGTGSEEETAGGNILFQDDFTDNTNNWHTFVDQNGTTDLENDGLRIFINEPSAYHWTNPELDFTDTIIEVEATRLGGPEENDFGVICRYQDENNFYFFTISSDGYYGIAKIVDGAEYMVGMEELEVDETAIKSGETTNLLRVECIGETLTLYANGKKLAEVSDADFAAGDIGLIASTYDELGTDILFDNLIVLLP